LNSRERVWAALELEEADRVPIWEMGIDTIHIETITGKEIAVEDELSATERKKAAIKRADITLLCYTLLCYEKLGFDAIGGGLTQPEDWEPQIFPDGTFTDEWGRIFIYDAKVKDSFQYYSRNLIKTIEDFENHPFPDPNAQGRTDVLEHLIRKVDGKMAVAGFTRNPFVLAWEIFGIENFFILLRKDYTSMKKIIERITDFNTECIKIMADLGVDFIVNNGDLAEERGPMLSLKYFEDLIFPCMRREVEAAHKRGLPFIKHTDGNINPLLEGFVKLARVDGLHSLDPSAGVDIGAVKEEYGDKLVLMGNVSVDKLALESKEKIIEETKNCIEKASPGGGHFLVSSNSWYGDAKLENCLTMVEVGKKYGVYPIRR